MNRTQISNSGRISRRGFLRGSAALGAGLAWPTIVPSSVFGQNAPSNRIAIGCIGVGRMGMGDLRELMGHADVQIVAVCDVDSKRAENAKKVVEGKYAAQTADGTYKGCALTGDFRKIIARQDIDAVSIVTPDHWHTIPAVAAAKAGKDIFLQKPLTLTIEEGRIMSNTVRRYGRVMQVGSQQRSETNFRQACELVRNGRIGKVHTVTVAFGTDPGCGEEPEMPVPANLDYDFWLGPAPLAPYTEKRVHPQADLGRPGWLRIMAYGHGMITGWGSHHLDIAQWGLGTSDTGPVEVSGKADFPKSGLWDVHGDFHIEYMYENGVRMICTDDKAKPHGIRFEGPDGWVHVRRGFIDANPKSLLQEKIGPDEIQLYRSNNHKRNWLDCIKSRGETVAPVENGHRSCTVCLLGSIAMQLDGRKLKWDPKRERFIGDDEANRMLSRPMRQPWRL